MSVKTPTATILERLSERSTSGFSKDEVLKLVKIIDSYHDFKVAKRVKGSGGDAKTLSAIASAVESPGGRSSPTSETTGAHFQIILNNFFNQFFLPKLDADTFFSTNGITKSSPEMSGRDFFERECGNVLHAALGGVCIPVVVNCSEMVKPEFNPSSISSSGAIIVERDRAFNKSVVNDNKLIGEKLLNWFFPSKGGKGKIAFCFDAQSAVLKEFVKPLIDTSKFHCIQIVTPQNVLDSAGIGYTVLSEPSKETGQRFEKLSDGKARTEYVVPTSEEFSNLFTEEYGKFSIQAGQTFNPDTMDFEWLFTPKGGKSISMGKGPEGHRRNTGPGVPFLAGMIDCVLTNKDTKALHACLDRRQDENDRMVSPVPAIEGLDKKWILRLIYDIKRLGDHEQANSVYYYNQNVNNTAIFVTGDTLSALYSRMLGNPTVYIRTEDETKADSDKGSYIMCYRGLEKNIPEDVKARTNVENTLSQLNYYFSKITAFIGLASKSDLSVLINNLETYKDAAPFTGEDGQLANLFLKAKLYNSLEFLNKLTRSLNPISNMLEAQKTTLINKIPQKTKPNFNESLTITLNKDLTVDELNRLNEFLTENMTILTPLMNSIISDLQYLNNFMVVSKDGTTVFSFHNTLFFSENKLETKLDTINYKKDDITFAVSAIINFARRPISGKRLQDAKDLILKYSTTFLNGFFSTQGFNKATWITSLEELVGISTNETIKETIMGVFNQILEMSNEANSSPEAEAIAAASNSIKELDKAVIESRNSKVVPPPEPIVEKVKAASKKVKETVKQAVQKVVQKEVAKTTFERPQTRYFLRQQEYVQKPVNQQQIATRMMTRLQSKQLAENAKKSLISDKSALVPVSKSTPKKGGDLEEDNELVQSMNTLFTSLSNIVLQINEYNVISLVPGNHVKDTQFYPHPMDFENDFIPMRTGLTAEEREKISTYKISPNAETVLASGFKRRSRKQRKSNRNTRKVGGYYDYIKSPKGAYTISMYDTLDQVNRVTEFFKSLKQYNKTLSGEDSPTRRNLLREQWYQFTSLLDAEGTPDLAESIDTNRFSYDIRMLKSYVEFATDINTNLAKETPLGSLDALDAAEVYQLLDPQETKRIGMNNIKAYSEVIALNEYEKKQTPTTFTKNIALCNYNIEMMKRQIEDTKLLIELVGEEATAPTEYQLGPLLEFEEDEEEESEPAEITPELLTEYFRSIEPIKGGRRRTYKSRHRSNNKSRSM